MELKQETDLQSKIPSGVAKSIFTDIQFLKQKQAEVSSMEQQEGEKRKNSTTPHIPIETIDGPNGCRFDHHGPTTSTTGSFMGERPVEGFVGSSSSQPTGTSPSVDFVDFLTDLSRSAKTSATNSDVAGSVKSVGSLAVDTSALVECPAWELDHLKINQKQDYNFCYEKMESMMEKLRELKVTNFTLSKGQLQEVTQNLVIPARFSYKFLNPDRLLKNVIMHDKLTNISYLRIKLAAHIMTPDEITEHVNLMTLQNNEEVLLQSRIQYAAYTPALIFGPFYIEWNRYGIASVRTKATSHDTIFFDAKLVKGNDEISLLLYKLATWICYWNGQKEFDVGNANCYTFCKTILENTGSFNDTPSHIRDFLELFKLQGVCCNTVHLSRDLMNCVQKFGSESLRSKLVQRQITDVASITFTNQRVFNEFTSIIQTNLAPNYLEENKCLKYQLQMIERGFWCDMERNGKTMDNEPLIENDECKAMFNPSGQLEKAFRANDEHIIHTDFEFNNFSVPYPKQ